MASPEKTNFFASGEHGRLLDQTMPLLAKSWQRDRIVLGLDGNFPVATGGRGAQHLQIDLGHAACPAIVSQGKHRVKLRYCEGDTDGARAALIAAASQSGWPIVGDEQSLALVTLAERIAKSEIPVLLEGPTGSGKEVFARFIHRMSDRAEGSFVAVNCAAMPEAMLEGLLFGHRKGAFTGAGEAREGLFRAADGGTLLLDEIGELPIALQAKLLRALQESEVLPLGATTPVKVDVRIVACTNRSLAAEVAVGRFREDLRYRLNVFPLELAALRERPGDIAPLAFGMLLRHARREEDPHWLAPEALELLVSHPWPGNVRELENVIRRAILLGSGSPVLGAGHIVFDQPVRPVSPEQGSETESSFARPSQAKTLSDAAFRSEAELILQTLDDHRGHRAQTARALGISERTLRYRLAAMRDCGMIAAGGRS